MDTTEDTHAESPENRNTIAVASIVEDGDPDEVRMILGDRHRTRPAGVIRPGIKVPLASAPAKAKAVYQQRFEAGDMDFDAIEKAMQEVAGTTKRLLRPSNADHFVVRPGDFRRPDDARKVLDLYADQEDGKLRSFPVWFTHGSISQAVPHNFRGFGGGRQIKFSSFYAPDGSLRCRYLPQKIEGRSPRRSDYSERCCPGDPRGENDPEQCPDYAAKRCRFGGLVRAHVPGLLGMGEIIVPTNSWHGLGEAVANLRSVRSVFGRFSGLFQGQPFLEVRKVQVDVKHGGKVGRQWIITIEPCVDLMMLAAEAAPEHRVARASAAMAALNGGGAHLTPSPRPSPRPTPAESEPQAEPEVTPEPPVEPEGNPAVEQAVGYLRAWAEHEQVGLDWELVEPFIRHHLGVQDLSEADLDDLRRVYQTLQAAKKAGGDEWMAVLDEMRSLAEGGGDLGYDPNDDVPF